MYHALHSPKDGEAPAWRAIDGPSDAMPGEAVVEERPKEGGVWDDAALDLRPRTEAEILAALKASKRAEMEAAFAGETAQSFGGGPAWAAVMVGAFATDARDARIAALKTRTAKLQQRVAAVNTATTQAAVEGVSWT